MGLQYSTPVPTDQDFSTPHEPLSKPLHTTRQLPCLEYSFQVPRNTWTKGASFDIVGLKVVPVKGNQKQCLVQDAEHGTILAVLQVQRYQHIQICTLADKDEKTDGSNAARVVGEYNGKLLLEYGTVMEREHHYNHILSVDGGPSYKMSRCGSKFFSPKDVVIQKQQKKQQQQGNADGALCAAYLTEEPNKVWGCRVAPGMDAVLVIAFVVCSDKLRLMFDDMLANKSGVMSSKIANVMP